MGNDDPCPYVELDKTCGKCVTCHAIDPPVMDKHRRRTCTRTRQWPGCPRYNAAWKANVTPYREGYAVTIDGVIRQTDVPPVKKVKKTGGIGGIGFTTGLPTQPREEPSIPCNYLVYKEGGCKSCGGYTCTATGDKRVMDNMLEVCMSEPGSCTIYQRESEET